jgi:hypothetical protein
MRNHTYRQDAAYELAGIEGDIRAAARSLGRTNKRSTVTIEESKLRGLNKRAAELRHMVATLPERPTRDTRDAGAGISFPTHPTPLTKEELDGLELPTCLRRTPATSRS